MMAFALSATLFLYFWLVGYPIVTLLHTRRDLVRNALIAPAVGVVITIYSSYVLSRIGVPVGQFARLLAVATLGLSGTIWIWRKPLLPGRHLAPYILILLFAFFATGWPLLTLGFAWVGDVNQDMMHYVLGAHRLVDQAYIQAPDPQTWLSRSDWTVYFAIAPALGLRTGSELLLAWSIALTGREGVAAYMVLLVAVHVALVFTATALISTPYRYARILTALLMSAAGMLSVSVALQLMAQVLGLMVLSLLTLLCLRPFHQFGSRVSLHFVALTGLVMAASFLTYPEVLPFFGIAFMINQAVFGNEMRSLGRVFVGMTAVVFIAAILTAPDVVGLATFLLESAQAANTGKRVLTQFPYFLVPTGLAALWGLTRFAPGESPAVPIAIVAGAALTFGGIASTFWLVWRREPAAAVAVVMLALAAYLFATDNGFGTLKFALYVQPFMLPVSVLALCLVTRSAR